MGKSPVYDLTSSSDAQTCGIRHIGIGIYTSGKIRDYLKNKGFTGEAYEDAVSNLIKRGYIDDVRAGRKVLLMRSGKKQESRAYLKQRLYNAGVSADASSVLLEEVAVDSDLCFNLYLSHIPSSSDSEEAESHYDELMKLAGKRGFSYEIAQSAYNMWLGKVTDD